MIKTIPKNTIYDLTDDIIQYENRRNLSWIEVYKEVLKKRKMEDKYTDDNLLRNVVKEITKRGYDIIGYPFKLERFK